MAVIGIDIGGTKTALGLLDRRELRDQCRIPTEAYDEALSKIVAICREWMAAGPVESVGIACAGPLRPSLGLVLNRDTLPGWFSKTLGPDLGTRLGLPATLINDADAALLGELYAGALAGHEREPAVMLTFGTGVGGAFWDGRRILAGAEEEHPEIGHIMAWPGGPPCYCGANGCLESMLSGTALNQAGAGIGVDGIAGLFGSAAAGRRDAQEPIGQAKEAFANALWTLTHAYRPAAFVLGGGVMESWFEQLAPKAVPVTLSTVIGEPPRIVKARLGNLAGLYGAAFAALRDQL